MAHDKSLDRIASDLSIFRISLGKWMSAYKKDTDKSFPGSGRVVDQELQALHKDE